MADEQVQILIKAVDEVSKTVNSIESRLESMSKTTERSSARMESSFTKVQGAMLNLGQIAQGVHNIFETYQNKTRILENAQDRLQNAELRLKQAFQGVAEAEQGVIDVHKKHERDSLNLERAQFNLEYAQKSLTKAIKQYGENSYEARLASMDLKEAQFDLADAQSAAAQKASDLALAQQNLANKQDDVTIANNNLERSQRAVEKAIGDANWMYVDMGVQILSVAGNIAVLTKALGVAGAAGNAAAAGTTAAQGAGLVGGLSAASVGVLGLTVALAGIGAYFYANKLAEEAKAYDALGNSAGNAAIKFRDLADAMKRTTGSKGTRITEPVYNGPKITPEQAFNGKTGDRVGDAIIRPNGQVIKTDPRDTIFATKNPESLANGGVVIYVTGNTMYGTDPDEIATEIFKKIRRKIAV